MKRPLGYPKTGTGFWDTHPEIREYAASCLEYGYSRNETLYLFDLKFGPHSQFNTTQISRLKQKLRVRKDEH